MKKNKHQVKNSNYFEVSNKTNSCIVVNSCNIVLKPMGESGDSIIVDESKTMDNDVVGLSFAGLIEIRTPKARKSFDGKIESRTPKTRKIKEKGEVLAKEKKEKKEKKSKVALNDKKGASVTYIDHGKVKKGKMSRSIQDLRIVDPNGNDNGTDDNDGLSDAFVDSK